MEIWKDIEGCDGKYQVSNKGNVRSVDTLVEYSDGRKRVHKGKVLKHLNCKEGYLKVNLWKNNKMAKPLVHTLVARAFLEDSYQEGYVVNHIDFDKTNNSVDNLEWVSHYDNVQHTVKAGRKAVGSKTNSSKLDEDKVKYIRNNYISCHPEFGAKALADKFNVADTLIYRVVGNIIWKHVT